VEIESGPREYAYSPGYYAVFLHDPDGIKVVPARERESAWLAAPTIEQFVGRVDGVG
jgi:hypothetical protein